MYGMELIESNPDPTKSAVMSRAAELVAEGYDRSAATSLAWDDISGEDYEEDDEEEISIDILGQRKNNTTRRNPTMTDNPTIGDGGLLAMAGVGFYLLWCAIAYKKSGTWSWKPWKPVAPIARRIEQPRRIGYDPVVPADDHSAEYITLIVP